MSKTHQRNTEGQTSHTGAHNQIIYNNFTLMRIKASKKQIFTLSLIFYNMLSLKADSPFLRLELDCILKGTRRPMIPDYKNNCFKIHKDFIKVGHFVHICICAQLTEKWLQTQSIRKFLS